MLGVGDSPAWLGDVYVGMSLIAQNTSNCRVMSWVTNPRTRHPVVAAAAVTTVDAISGGRAVLGLGSGETGVHNLGVKRATLAQLEDFIGTVRTVWDTGRVRLGDGNSESSMGPAAYTDLSGHGRARDFGLPAVWQMG